MKDKYKYLTYKIIQSGASVKNKNGKYTIKFVCYDELFDSFYNETLHLSKNDYHEMLDTIEKIENEDFIGLLDEITTLARQMHYRDNAEMMEEMRWEDYTFVKKLYKKYNTSTKPQVISNKNFINLDATAIYSGVEDIKLSINRTKKGLDKFNPDCSLGFGNYFSDNAYLTPKIFALNHSFDNVIVAKIHPNAKILDEKVLFFFSEYLLTKLNKEMVLYGSNYNLDQAISLYDYLRHFRMETLLAYLLGYDFIKVSAHRYGPEQYYVPLTKEKLIMPKTAVLSQLINIGFTIEEEENELSH